MIKIFFSLVVLSSNLAFAESNYLQEPTQRSVQKFFSNYGLITDWVKFQEAQRILLSPQMKTIVIDHLGTTTYTGPEGYFSSLSDWSKYFSTGSDFHIEIKEVNYQRVVVRIHGKIIFKTPINGFTEISDDQHSWTEIFFFDSSGQIKQLQVLMNLFRN